MVQAHYPRTGWRVSPQWLNIILPILIASVLLLLPFVVESAFRPAEVASAQTILAPTTLASVASPGTLSLPLTSVTAAEGPGEPYTITLTVDPPAPWITETARVTATVIDKDSNLLSGQVITFSSGQPGTVSFGTVIFVGPVTGTTDENGQGGVTIASDSPGDKVVRATAANGVYGTTTVHFRSTTYLFLPLVLKNYPPPQVGFSNSSFNIDNSAGAATIVVALTAQPESAVSVDYATGDLPGIMATAGSDYIPVSGTLTFTSGEAIKTFNVPILPGTPDRSNKAIALTLNNPVNIGLASSQARLNILSSPMAPNVTVQFDADTYSVNENAGMAAIRVMLSAPSSQPVTVDYVTQNGMARAWSDYMPEYGTLTFAPGEVAKVLNVTIINDQEVEPAETILLILSNPVNATLGVINPATLTIVDDDSAASPTNVTVQFSAATYSVNENVGKAIITVTLSGPSALAIVVDYAIADGTAKAWSDYTPTFGTLTFAPGETVKTFDVSITNDALVEPSETTLLMLGNSINAALGTPNLATLIIIDDETTTPTSVTAQFSAATYSVNENAGAAVINVMLSAASSQIVMVNYATSDGTALAPGDYTAVGGALTFAPGETSKTLSVPLVDDALIEGNETVSLTLSNPVNAALGAPNTATLIIIDDETTPTSTTVQFSAATYSVTENAGAAIINVTLDAVSSQSVTVSYATSNGTATAPGDYTAVSGMLTFAPGETIKTFSVPMINDALVEGNETVLLTLYNPVNATLGAPNPVTLIIIDDETTPTSVTVRFDAATYSVNENGGTAVINVILSAASSQNVMVSYATSNGTATAPGDYTAVSGMLAFAPGETVKTLGVSIINDTLVEPNETVLLALNNPVNAVLGTPSMATLTIVDDDGCAPQVAYAITSNYSPRGMALDTSRNRLFVANRDGPGSGSLAVLNASSGQLIQSLPGLPSAHGVAFDAIRNRIYVAGGSTLYVVDGLTYNISSIIPLGYLLYAQAVAYNPTADKIYVGFRDSPAVAIVNAATLQIIATLSGEDNFHEVSGIAVNPISNKVYVSNKKIGGWVTVLDGRTDTIVTTIVTTGDLFGITVDTVHNRVYVASIGASRIYAINGATDQLISDIQILRNVDGRPVPLRHIAVNPNAGAGIHLWLTSGSDEGSWGMDRLIVLGGNWPDMGQPQAIEIEPGAEGGLLFEPAFWYVFTARAAANKVFVSRDGPSLCPTPLSTNQDWDDLSTVVHNYRRLSTGR